MRFLSKIILFSIPVFSLLLSQKATAQHPGYPVGFKIEGKDTVYQIRLRDLYLFSRPQGRMGERKWREYYRLVYNFKRTYPYALTAKAKIVEADSIINFSNFSRKEREKFINRFEDQLFREFEKPLRNMTFSQGRLLLKLIDREVGQSSYYLIRNYKGGFTAGFWQGVAKIFGSDLKKPYDRFGEDRATEELVIMYYNGSFDYLYYSLFYN